MANLTITIPDAVIPRVQTAFGRTVSSGPLGAQPTRVHVDATLTEVQAQVKAWVKQKVQAYEGDLANQVKSDSVSAEVW